MCEEIVSVNNKIKNLPINSDIHNLFLKRRKTIDFKWTTDGADLGSGQSKFLTNIFEIFKFKIRIQIKG